ncbi:MAG: UDP-2,3-diacylglucosamine diphosphatase LpxI [Planctomycetales bacterium]|nr:UDP-2,3-diacylglucosamine diphosphatase LpxI [Planctomycetales bacterium]
MKLRVYDSLDASCPQAPVGLLAGWGRLPLEVAAALRAQGRRVIGLGVRDHASPELAELCDEFAWIGVGSVGRAIRLFRRAGVRRAVMAGKIHKVQLLRPGWWTRHFPDWKCLTAFSSQIFTGRKDSKDDTLLMTLVDTFAASGIVFEPATDIAPELLVKEGMVAGRPLTSRQLRDVQFGWSLAKHMGGLDVGQTVCVKNQAVLAIEAVEGTDLCIRRAGELCRHSGFTVVKVAKPKQDMRFDVPTVGRQTLETLAAAGGNVLAIEADATILLEGDEFRQLAKRLKISVAALKPSQADVAAA